MQAAKILLLDDDRETRWALATVLRREGAQVTEGSDGEEGLRFLMRSQFDLCVTDVCMPGLGGFGLYATVRFGDSPELAWARTMPVILLSGQIPPRDLAHALDAGVDDILEKPFDPEELKSRVRAAIRRSKLLHGPTARTHGNLADFGMGALAQGLRLAARSARVRITSARGAALLDFQRGEVSHAELEDLGVSHRGDEAAVRILALQEGVFEILPLPETVPHTVLTDTSSLLLRAATWHDENVVAAALGEAEAVARASEPPPPVVNEITAPIRRDATVTAPVRRETTAPVRREPPTGPTAPVGPSTGRVSGIQVSRRTSWTGDSRAKDGHDDNEDTGSSMM